MLGLKEGTQGLLCPIAQALSTRDWANKKGAVSQQVFPAGLLFIVTKTCKQSRCPVTGDQLGKRVHQRHGAWHSIRRTELLMQAATWTDHERTTLNEKKPAPNGHIVCEPTNGTFLT